MSRCLTALRPSGTYLAATLDFLHGKAAENWGNFRDSVIGNFRVISPKDFRAVT